MELILCMGIQATGKSTFCRQRFLDTHIRLNLDMLRTRHRETLLFNACLEAKQPVVIDNTNPTSDDRQRYIEPAKASRFKVVGYYFQSQLQEAIERNGGRPEAARIPEAGIRAVYSKLDLPQRSEGFDELYYVRIDTANTADGTTSGFTVMDWNDEL